ncbi:MAG: hypothetical protein ACKO7W_07905, partial [Elainella sp.]
MAEHSIVRLAKQGDPKAIAYLITRSLRKYGITARAARKQGCLKLLLEAEQLPHQATMVKLVEQGLHKLSPTGLDLVKIYGRRQDQPTPAWRHVLELAPSAPADTRPAAELASREPEETLSEEAAAQIFRLDDLDPEAMILLPIDPQVQIDDLDPEALILLPLEPAAPDESQRQPSALSGGAVSPHLSGSHQSHLDQNYLDQNYLDQSYIGQRDPDSGLLPPQAAFDSPSPVDRASIDHQQVDYQQPDRQLDHQQSIAVPFPEQSVEPLDLNQPPKRPPKRLTLLLLVLLWVGLLINSFGLIYALLSAGSLSLYAGLDLSNTNQPFAGLLALVVGIADFIFTPFSRTNLWVGLVALVLVAIWLHRIHASLRNLLTAYPISPASAVVRFALPVLNLWGWGSLIATMARQLAQTSLANLKPISQTLRQLLVWLYVTLLALLGLALLGSLAVQSLLLEWLDRVAPTLTPLVTPVFDFILTSPWYDVARSA